MFRKAFEDAKAPLNATPDALADLLFVVDPEGRIGAPHPDSCELFRVPPAHFLGRTLNEVLPEPTADIIVSALAEARQRGIHRGAVYSLETPRGVRWFELSIAARREDAKPSGCLIALAHDITKRKQAEEDARENEARFRLVFEAASDVVTVHALPSESGGSGRFMQVNEAGCKLVGYHHDELLRMTPFDLMAGNGSPDLAAARAKLRSEGQALFEDALIAKDGKSIPVEIHSRLCTLGGGPVILSIVRDITKRRETENALRVSEEHLRTVADFTFNWESWFGPSGTLRWVSPSVQRVTGYSPEDCHAMRGFMMPLVCEEDREKLSQEFAAAVAGGSGEGVVFRFRRKDGEVRWASASYRPVLNAKGSCIGHRSCILDITKKRHAEMALRQSEEMSRAILEQAAEGFVLVDDSGVVSEWNLAMERLSGVERTAILGRFIWDVQFESLLFPEPKTKDLHKKLEQGWRTLLRTGQSPDLQRSIQATVLRADGELRTYERVLFPIDSGSKRVFGAIIHDTTEHRRAEEALRTSQDSLRALSRRIESIREEAQCQIAREIHDGIGQSVSGMAMSLGWIARRLPPTVESEVRRELKDMEAVLSGLTSKVQEMTMRLRPRILDELGLKEAITAEVQGFSERTSIHSTSSISLCRHALDGAGTTAVFRICQEALTNVYRHAKASAVHVSLGVQESRVLLTVSDNGCGITDEQGRAPKSLGILGMQERALALGGSLTVTGRPGAGTTVTLCLPVAHRPGRRRRQAS